MRIGSRNWTYTCSRSYYLLLVGWAIWILHRGRNNPMKPSPIESCPLIFILMAKIYSVSKNREKMKEYVLDQIDQTRPPKWVTEIKIIIKHGILVDDKSVHIFAAIFNHFLMFIAVKNHLYDYWLNLMRTTNISSPNYEPNRLAHEPLLNLTFYSRTLILKHSR